MQTTQSKTDIDVQNKKFLTIHPENADKYILKNSHANSCALIFSVE